LRGDRVFTQPPAKAAGGANPQIRKLAIHLPQTTDVRLSVSLTPTRSGSRQAGAVPLTRIGTVVVTPGVTMIDEGVRSALPPGYVHFR